MKKKGFTLTDLNKLVMQFEKENKDKTLLKHYIGRLFENDKLLGNYVEKNVPTKKINELTGADGTPLSIKFNEVIYEAPPKKD